MVDFVAFAEAWDHAVADPDWPERVLNALQEIFGRKERLIDEVALVDSWIERSGSAGQAPAFLVATYRHPYDEHVIGLKRRLDEMPAAGDANSTSADDLARWLALWIANFDMAEPLGRQADLLVYDERGIGWWGDGYPRVGP
jgi:hypothetical protein